MSNTAETFPAEYKNIVWSIISKICANESTRTNMLVCGLRHWLSNPTLKDKDYIELVSELQAQIAANKLLMKESIGDYVHFFEFFVLGKIDDHNNFADHAQLMEKIHKEVHADLSGLLHELHPGPFEMVNQQVSKVFEGLTKLKNVGSTMINKPIGSR